MHVLPLERGGSFPGRGQGNIRPSSLRDSLAQPSTKPPKLSKHSPVPPSRLLNCPAKSTYSHATLSASRLGDKTSKMAGGVKKPVNVFRLKNLGLPKEVFNWRLWFSVFSFGLLGAARVSITFHLL